MSLMSWMDARVARFSALDIGLLKICVLAFGLIVAKLWPSLLTPDWKIFGGIFLVTYLPLAVKLFVGKNGHA